MAVLPLSPCFVFDKDELIKSFKDRPTGVELYQLPDGSNLFWPKGEGRWGLMDRKQLWTRKDLTPILESCIPKTQRVLAMLLIN